MELTYTNTGAVISKSVITDLDGNIIANGNVSSDGRIEFEAAQYKSGSYLIVVLSDSGIGDCNAKFME